jgi:hypothetical protein
MRKDFLSLKSCGNISLFIAPLLPGLPLVSTREQFHRQTITNQHDSNEKIIRWCTSVIKILIELLNYF